MSLKHQFIRAFWGDAFYRFAMRPFDGWRFDVLPARSFANQPVPLNKVCRVSDADDPLWQSGYGDLGFPADRARFHRKIWEFNHTLYGLRRLRRLAPESTALGIACGHEELMYFLANRIRTVAATDLYEGLYLGGESNADVLEFPEKYAPFPYRRDHLVVRRMDALALDAAPETFDFVFCLSSLEHFGGVGDKQRALEEMRRVLKPGGVAVVTTELVLNRLGRGRQYFPVETLLTLVRAAGFVLETEPDLRLEQEYASAPLALPMGAVTVPHVVLRNFNTIYTSVALFLMKPAGTEPSRHAVVGDEVVVPIEGYRHGAEFRVERHPAPVVPGRMFETVVVVKNTGSDTWFVRAPGENMVCVGAWFTAADGRNVSGEPARFGIPHILRPGEEAPVFITLPAPRPPGRERVSLTIGLVKERRYWFREKGVADFSIPLSYEEPDAAGP